MTLRPPPSTLFPYTTLFRSAFATAGTNLNDTSAGGLHERGGQQRNQQLVMARQREAAARSRGRPVDDIRERPVVPQEIQVHRRQAVERAAVVARDRDGLQEHLGQHHRGAAIQIDTALQTRDRRDEILEIAEAGGRCQSEEHTSELQSQSNLVCRLLLEKKKNT